MMYAEFVERTGVKVDAIEFDAINIVYLESDLDKDQFCAMWRRMNASRVKKAREEAKKKVEKELRFEKLWKIKAKCHEAIIDKGWGQGLCYKFLSETEKRTLEEEGFRWNGETIFEVWWQLEETDFLNK